MKKMLIISLMLFAAAAPSHAGDASDIKEGMWEITTKVNMPGMQAPASVQRQCISSKNSIPMSALSDQGCRVLETKISGGAVSWTMQCNGQGGQVDGKGAITYAGDSFSGTSNMTISAPGAGKTDISTSMTGRRVGDCK